MARHIAMLSWLSGHESGAGHGSARHSGTHREAVAPELLEIASLDNTAVLGRLDTSPRGLEEAEAARRRGKLGENRIAHEQGPGFLRQLGARLLNPLVIL